MLKTPFRRLRVTRWTFFVLWLMAGLTVWGQSSLYLRVEEVKGRSKDADHVDWFDIESVHFQSLRHMNHQIPGRPIPVTLHELTVSRPSDASTPLLVREALMGEGKDVEIDFVRGSKNRERYYRLKLSDAMIKEFTQGSGGDLPWESITFDFTRIDLTYTEYLPTVTRQTTGWFEAVVQQSGFSALESAPNTAPAVPPIGDYITFEDQPVTVPFTANDPEGTSLSFSASTSDPVLLPLGNIEFGGSGSNRTVRLWPGTNQHGSVTVSLTASDGALSTVESFTLTVIPVNDAPLIQPIPAHTTFSNTPALVMVHISDVDHPLEELVLGAASGNPAVQPVFTFSGTGSPRNLTVRPPVGFTGTFPIIVTVSDGGLTSSNTFQFTVLAETFSNTPPAFLLGSSNTLTAIAGRWMPITGLQVADLDAGAALLTLRISANGTLAISNAVGLHVTNNGSSLVTLSGTVAALNSMLANDGLHYRAPAGASGIDQIELMLNDNGASGAGGPMTAELVLGIRFFRDQFQEWQHGAFTAAELEDGSGEATLWGWNADPDGDGLDNLAEYALGTHPRSATHARPAPQFKTVGGQKFLTLEIARRRDPNLQLTVEVAGEIGGSGWTSDPSAVESSSAIDLGNGFETIVITDKTPAGPATTRFLRMRWTLNSVP